MATVLGMLIFVGVLFTCVIPLFLYVNEVNSIYDESVMKMRLFDQERGREQIDVYAFPLGEPNDNLLNIYVKNRGTEEVQIVRAWVNDEKFDLSFEVGAMLEGTIESLDITELLPETGTEAFNVKVTTSKGNVFSSLTNTLYYTDGFWSGGGGFTIQIVIEAPTGGTRFFHIEITRDGNPSYLYETDIVKRPHESTCFCMVTVIVADTYHIAVSEGQTPLVPIPDSVTVDSSQPSQWVYVYA
jgi:hypothetical protein